MSSGNSKRVNISSGGKWEGIAGYSRAVRIGNIVEVAGTTAANNEGEVEGKGDAGEQTRVILGKIKEAVEKAGGRLEDVIRTRIFVTDMKTWEAVTKVHGEFFRDIRPATTLVEVSKFIGGDMMVEIEASAVISE